jgi:hypothetical protein
MFRGCREKIARGHASAFSTDWHFLTDGLYSHPGIPNQHDRVRRKLRTLHVEFLQQPANDKFFVDEIELRGSNPKVVHQYLTYLTTTFRSALEECSCRLCLPLTLLSALRKRDGT